MSCYYYAVDKAAGHACCYSASVKINEDGKSELVCETYDFESAEMIATALNLYFELNSPETEGIPNEPSPNSP